MPSPLERITTAWHTRQELRTLTNTQLADYAAEYLPELYRFLYLQRSVLSSYGFPNVQLDILYSVYEAFHDPTFQPEISIIYNPKFSGSIKKHAGTTTEPYSEQHPDSVPVTIVNTFDYWPKQQAVMPMMTICLVNSEKHPYFINLILPARLVPGNHKTYRLTSDYRRLITFGFKQSEWLYIGQFTYPAVNQPAPRDMFLYARIAGHSPPHGNQPDQLFGMQPETMPTF